ncbi:cell division protein FtsQ/DivIB [Halomonas huangheensis]|uniref:Cell division protein FtsQ n=1 Tax=Halomonas huangheensis TaxID=1178482 RepID=W1N563_9GAMM|nr:cell division protein FtsQ/DivIB [Halomonas huangheensis]ALM52146.1 cell division protein FtsQ [Halomonas huangheensis]ERL50712.1 hypothetical protein BJB45_06150 [Halomonas huangheensis]
MARRSTLFGILLLGLLLAAGGNALWLWLDKPIQRVSIRGELQYADSSYLKNQLTPLVRGQTWLSVDLEELRERAMKVGWLHEVRIRREWPNALMFELTEQVPVAYWNDDQLLNSDGTPFDFGPVTPPDDMPVLAGPKGSGQEVLDYYADLSSRFGSMGVGLEQLRLEARGAWRFQLDDGVWVMLGRNDRVGRLGRLEAAWQRELGSVASHIRYIDLRYPNGVAVAWHGETEPVAEDGSRQG